MMRAGVRSEDSARGGSTAPRRPDALFVATASYSGSTLLGLLLDRHPQVVSTSQLVHLPMHAAHPDLGGCTCGVAVGACPFWSAVAARLAPTSTDPAAALAALDIGPRPAGGRLEKLAVHAALLGAPAPVLAGMRSLAPSLDGVMGSAKTFFAITDAIRAERPGAVVVDASKDWSLAIALHAHAPRRVRFVHLVRDGRAVMASRIRRLGESPSRAARVWLIHNLILLRLQRRLSAPDRLRLRYEDLCRAPREAVGRVLRHARVDAPDVPVTLCRDGSHLVGGNPMRYRHDESEIVLDERWRKDLDASDLRAFERLGGRLNRHFGYS